MKLIPSNGISVGDRDEQQDDFGFSDPLAEHFVYHGGLLAVVVDGMGGVKYGAECASAGKAAFLRAYEMKVPGESINQALERALHQANEAVLAIARRYGDPKSVGATLTAAVVWRERLTWISVGDSALYLLRDDRLQRLTLPHETVGPDGQMYVSSFLGLPNLTQIERPAGDVLLHTGDRVLVCTDGLFKTLTDEAIARALAAAPSSQAGSDLVDAALAMRAPEQDNVTALVLSCEPAGTPSPITSKVEPATRWWLFAAIAAILLLASGLAAFGWSRYRQMQEAARLAKQAAEVQAAFTAGNCSEVLKLMGPLADRPDTADRATASAQACQLFVPAAEEGNREYEAAMRPSISAAERRQHLTTAIERLGAALAQQVPGIEADRVRARLDDAKRQLEGPAETATESGGRKVVPKPNKQADPDNHDTDRQKSAPAKRGGR